MITLVVASINPVKIQAAVNGFQRLFPDSELTVIAAAVLSDVAHQPMSDEETLRGALNRSANAQAAHPNADYWIGIEGGIQPIEQEMMAFAWIVVRSKEMIGKGRTGTLFLPPAVAELIRQGKELGEADDIVFGRSNSKQDNGAVGLLTDNVIDRTRSYEHAMILALIPFKNEGLYTLQDDA
ncbi:MAG TPA: inosine/xanthosine triphosphatase [Anaerolineae bacterium]|nr:inosine/xanthosine triphosphatase [Anaerolineae bacterium]